MITLNHFVRFSAIAVVVLVLCFTSCVEDEFEEMKFEQILNDTVTCSGATFSACLGQYQLDIDLDGQDDVIFEINSYTHGAADYSRTYGLIQFLNPDWVILSKETDEYYCTDTIDLSGGYFRYVVTRCLESDDYAQLETNEYPLALNEEELENFATDTFKSDWINIFHKEWNFEFGTNIHNQFNRGIKDILEEGTYFVFRRNINGDLKYFALKLKSRGTLVYYQKVIEL